MKHIYLIGFMGCGKSAVASCIAKKKGIRNVEMDACIVQKEGKSIPEIFDEKGESYFRDRETELLREIQCQEESVISCGGGAVIREENVELMKKSGTVVLLTASPETILERVKDDEERPLLRGNKNVPFIAEMMRKRSPLYEGAADAVVSTDGKTPDAICDQILEIIMR